jgi:hypothetical protein
MVRIYNTCDNACELTNESNSRAVATRSCALNNGCSRKISPCVLRLGVGIFCLLLSLPGANGSVQCRHSSECVAKGVASQLESALKIRRSASEPTFHRIHKSVSFSEGLNLRLQGAQIPDSPAPERIIYVPVHTSVKRLESTGDRKQSVDVDGHEEARVYTKLQTQLFPHIRFEQ